MEELNANIIDLKIGTWTNLVTAKREDTLISVLEKFVNSKISSVPIIDDEGHVLNVYEKYDVLVLKSNLRCLRKKDTII